MAFAQSEIRYFGGLEHVQGVFLMAKQLYFTQVSEVDEILYTNWSVMYMWKQQLLNKPCIQECFESRILTTSGIGVK
jgi:hypothetical protein